MNKQDLILALEGAGFKDGNTVVLATDFGPFMGKISAFDYLDTVLTELPAQTTLLMNAFSWDFCSTQTYHHEETPVETGIIPELFRRTPGTIRSQHPIYSFCAYGSGKERYARHSSVSCFGGDNPFSLQLDDNVLYILVGLEVPYRITLLHRFEEEKAVPYRCHKTFRGSVDFGEGYRNYSTDFFVRKDMDQCYSWEPAAAVLEGRKMIRRAVGMGISVTAVSARNLKTVFHEMLDEDPLVFLC